jgi:HD-like signal output (HDOD) protein
MQRSVNDVLAEIKSVEPLPQVAMRVVALSGDEDVVPREIVEVIQTDAGVTAKVLKLCNSAYYGFQREIASLPEAGNLLGVSTLVNLVLTSCAGRYFRNYGGSSAETTLRLWEATVSSAFATSFLAGRTRLDKSRAYTLGLLENIGHLVLQRFFAENATRVNEEVERGMPLLEAEALVWGLDHAEIGARLASRWNFPELLVDSIRHHHAPTTAEIDPRMTALGHLGEMATQRFQINLNPGGAKHILDSRALDLLGLSAAMFTDLEQPLEREIAKAKGILEIA